MDAVEEILKNSVGQIIEIGIVHHGEVMLRITTGRLVSYNEEIIHMKLETKDHFWSRIREDADYYLNRRGCSLLSIVVYKDGKRIK